ncbi:sigma-70 family RNA polymerase sigma factor [Chryseolinea sp. H1M3-3]|uniref:RNA polymerase sigma factor n=1 Tax=Chryseolinea sp. H1M3-3 TaxID=3034144 RepID=UPI0023EE156B|nr:sigma-70 family RNA polymerase sigma factor [Chryseolinea sp. H1M3-3]
MNKAAFEDKFLEDVNANIGIVHRICNSYYLDPDERDDLFQDILYQLWKSYPSFNGDSKFSTWMYRVALNTAIAGYRKQKRSFKKESLTGKILEVPSSNEQQILDEQMTLLYTAINGLSPVDKAIVLLFLDECSYDQIASIVGISRNNVSVKLVRIKKKLEERLKDKMK